ncbi:MAG: type VI secretion system protein TssA [Holosporales bacterium]
MRLPFDLDDCVDEILKPIPGAVPVGRFLNYDKVYDIIRDARHEEDDQVPQGIWKRPLKKADWSLVAATSLEALTHQSKDLQLAVWLCEAWLHLHGIPGFSAGCRVIREVCLKYWPDVHPQILHQDVGYRLAPIEWMDEKFPLHFRFVPITDPGEESPGPLTVTDYEAVKNFENLQKQGPRGADLARQIEQEGHATPQILQTSWRNTPASFYQDSLESLNDALEEVKALESFLIEQTPEAVGILRRTTEGLEAIYHILSSLQKNTKISPKVRTDEKSERSRDEISTPPKDRTPLKESPSMAKLPLSADQIESRGQAYQLLAIVADYLESVEPHSPTPFLVRRAIEWGSKSFIELLPELVADQNDLAKILRALGLANPQKPGDKAS